MHTITLMCICLAEQWAIARIVCELDRTSEENHCRYAKQPRALSSDRNCITQLERLPGLHFTAGSLERLRQMIIRCELKPGDRISEVDFVQAFGVSRTPLREALKLLAAEGLVRNPPTQRRGYR